MKLFRRKASGDDRVKREPERSEGASEDKLLEEQMRQHKREQIKRDGFDFDEELRRMASDDDPS